MIHKYISHISAHSNSESRLIYFQQGSSEPDSDAQTFADKEIKKTKEERAKEKTEAKISSITSLRSQVKIGNFSGGQDKDLQNTASRIIDNYEQVDEDDYNQEELALLEDLVEGRINKSTFRKDLEKLREKRNRKNSTLTSAAYATRVGDVVDNLERIAPQVPESNSEFGKQMGELHGVNRKIKGINSDIAKRLEEYRKNGEISEARIQEIIDLDPSSKIFEQKLLELLGPLAKEKALVNDLKVLKLAQKKEVVKGDALIEKLNDVLRDQFGKFEFIKQRRTRMYQVSKMLGLNIDEDLELNLMIPDKNTGKLVTTKARITNIEYGINEEGEVPNIQSPDFVKKFQDKGLTSVHALKFEIKYKDSNGEDVTETLGEGGIRKMANAYNATEYVDSQTDLESKLRYDQFGRKLKEGQVFEYISDYSSPGMPEFSSIRIEDIDKTAGEITMSEPIKIMPYMTNLDDGLVHKKKTVTFGEFLKWHTLTHAEEKMDIRQAREILKKAPKVFQKEVNEFLGGEYKIAEEPIQIKKGERLRSSADNTDFNIVSVTTEGVILSTGAYLTLGQFVRFVNENRVEKAVDLSSRVQDVLKTQVQAAGEGESYFNTSEASSVSSSPSGSSSGSGGRRRFSISRQSERQSTTGAGKSQAIGNKDKMPKEGLGFHVAKDLYKATTMLSIRNLIDMGTTIGEFIDRRWKRGGKGRMARVGKKLPMVGPEFDKVAQQVETEEVNQYQETMVDYPIQQIKERLYNTSNQDEAKACLNLLSEKGALRIDDQDIWKTLNRLAYKKLPRKTAFLMQINMLGGKNRAGMVPEDAAKAIMDALWGDESGKDWESKNLSGYNSAVSGFEADANGYEGDPKRMGGIAAELHNMLIDHMNGDTVDTGRFEGFIDFIIKAGKARMTDKLYYIIAGVALRNSKGKTLLDNKTFARMTLKYQSSNLPLLEWFTRFQPQGYDGTIMPMEYMEDLMKDFQYKPNVNRNNPNERYDFDKVNNYLTGTVLTHNSSLSRTSRAIRNAENMDHDDTQYIIPLVNAADIEQSVITNVRGQRSAFTQDGFTNAIWGYGAYLKKLADIAKLPPEEHAKRDAEGQTDNNKLIAQVLKSFHSFEGTANGRANYGKDFLKIDGTKLNAGPPANPGGPTVQQHIDNIKKVYAKILQAYGFSPQEIQRYLEHRASSPEDQKAHDQEMKNFKNEFESRVMQADGGRKMAQVLVQNENLISL